MLDRYRLLVRNNPWIVSQNFTYGEVVHIRKLKFLLVQNLLAGKVEEFLWTHFLGGI